MSTFFRWHRLPKIPRSSNSEATGSAASDPEPPNSHRTRPRLARIYPWQDSNRAKHAGIFDLSYRPTPPTHSGPSPAPLYPAYRSPHPAPHEPQTPPPPFPPNSTPTTHSPENHTWTPPVLLATRQAAAPRARWALRSTARPGPWSPGHPGRPNGARGWSVSTLHHITIQHLASRLRDRHCLVGRCTGLQRAESHAATQAPTVAPATLRPGARCPPEPLESNTPDQPSPLTTAHPCNRPRQRPPRPVPRRPPCHCAAPAALASPRTSGRRQPC
mmetsp:Transcript_89494/g.239923  ORF Transcript_89494/g.239923 Transcript_89494/m.239923 type:complete len:273 (+) Transcript_89494:338-1156(+)